MDNPIIFTPVGIPSDAACRYFVELEKDLNWVHRENTPRKEYWTNTENRDYTYGRGMGERTYSSDVTHWIINIIAEIARGAFDIDYVKYGCFLNRYDDNKDALGWHADDDPGIDHTMPILVVTLYKNEPKPDRLRHLEVMPIGGTKADVVSYGVTNGSFLIMKAGMQDEYYHRIPKAGYEVEPRISLTYRALK